MTGDLMLVAEPDANNRRVYTEEFIGCIQKNLEKNL